MLDIPNTAGPTRFKAWIPCSRGPHKESVVPFAQLLSLLKGPVGARYHTVSDFPDVRVEVIESLRISY